MLCGPIVIRDARLGRWESHVTSIFHGGIYSCRLVMSKQYYTGVNKDQQLTHSDITVGETILREGFWLGDLY